MSDNKTPADHEEGENLHKYGVFTPNLDRLREALGLREGKHTADSVARIAIERFVLSPCPANPRAEATYGPKADCENCNGTGTWHNIVFDEETRCPCVNGEAMKKDHAEPGRGWDPVGGRPIDPDVLAAAAMSEPVHCPHCTWFRGTACPGLAPRPEPGPCPHAPAVVEVYSMRGAWSIRWCSECGALWRDGEAPHNPTQPRRTVIAQRPETALPVVQERNWLEERCPKCLYKNGAHILTLESRELMCPTGDEKGEDGR